MHILYGGMAVEDCEHFSSYTMLVAECFPEFPSFS